MQEEIKEILDKLKDENWYDELDLTGTKWVELKWEETHLLLDYITNLQQEINKLTAESTEWESKCYELQQENERLNNCIDDQERVINGLIDKRDLYKINYNDYKYRCEKASEYINTHYLNANEPELLNILQGSDKE